MSAGVAQLVEQLICNQQVAGSSPITSSMVSLRASGQMMDREILEGFPSGQREQTVNLPAYAYEGSNPSPSTSRVCFEVLRSSVKAHVAQW